MKYRLRKKSHTSTHLQREKGSKTSLNKSMRYSHREEIVLTLGLKAGSKVFMSFGMKPKVCWDF